MGEQQSLPVGIDPGMPNIARVYDYALGGKNNFAADREIIDELRAIMPFGTLPAEENRAFLRRAVRMLAHRGIRQFLDLGSGLPTQGNVHEVVHEVAADARIVYVDHEPQVVVHSRELLSGTRNATVLQADIRRPDSILGHPEVRSLLDFSQPMAVLFCAVLHAIDDADDPAGIVARFRDAVAPGSYVVISHLSTEQHPEGLERVAKLWERVREPMRFRTAAHIRGLFEGLELIDPGLVSAPQWHPDRVDPTEPQTDAVKAGVGYRR